jgi:uncharacterized protein (DUF1330 family)
MSCYFVARIRITDPDEYRKYLDGYDTVFEKFRGEVIIVDDHPTLLEGVWEDSRIVVIRFPDKAEARRWYDSEEYRALATHRWQSSQADIILAQGR